MIPNLAGGGAERVLINIANNLDKNKYDVTICTLFRENTNAQYLLNDVRLIRGKLKQFRGNTYLFKLFRPRLLYKCFVKEKYDIAVSFLEGATARIVAGCPDEHTRLVSWTHVEQHSLQVATSCFRSFNEAVRLYNRYNQHVFVSNNVQEDFCSIFSLSTNKMVLYNPVEDAIIRERSQERVTDVHFSKYINVVTVGRLMEQKGYDRLIRVHKRLRDKGIIHHIYLLGTGDVCAYQKLIDENHVNDTFHLLGYKENPYKYVASADLFICSSRREGFSTAVTESLIVGTPVVSTLCSGAIELLGEDNQYGIVVENSEDGIFDGMQQMLTSSEKRHHYAKQAVERSKFFSKSNCMERIESMFDNLLA